jgi:hypothetical protein
LIAPPLCFNKRCFFAFYKRHENKTDQTLIFLKNQGLALSEY